MNARGRHEPRINFRPPPEMLAEMHAEARRLDRTIGWVLRHAWQKARPAIARIPGAETK